MGGELGTGVTLDFSFPAGVVSFATAYGIYSDAGEWRGVQSLSQGEQSAARSALDGWHAVSGLDFQEVADNAGTVGELRFASTLIDSAQEFAHAYFPNTDPSAGDVWLSAVNWNSAHPASIARGSDDYQTLLHEIGHAVGLKHSFEGAYALPAAHDNYFFTLMSYSAKRAGDDGWASFYPTTPMYEDLVAIQALYGRNMDHNSGEWYTPRQSVSARPDGDGLPDQHDPAHRDVRGRFYSGSRRAASILVRRLGDGG